MSKTNKSLEITIKGYKWRVLYQLNSSYVKSHGKDSYHICYPEDRTIYFNKKYINFDFVVHELAHAFVWSTDTEHTANMSSDDVEDLCVTTFSKNYFEIGKLAQEILNYVLKSEE